jgi:hypothetical protein
MSMSRPDHSSHLRKNKKEKIKVHVRPHSLKNKSANRKDTRKIPRYTENQRSEEVDIVGIPSHFIQVIDSKISDR